MPPSAPVQFADPSASGIGLYYVAPPEGHNVAAAFMSGFLQTRLPWAQQVFTARLAALDPTARNEALARLQGERTKLLEQLAANDRVREQSAASLQGKEVDKFNEILKARTAERGMRSAESVARAGLAGEILKARQVTSESAERIRDDAFDAIGVARDRIARGEDPLKVTSELAAKLDSAKLEAANLNPMEAEALSGQIANQVLAASQFSTPEVNELFQSASEFTPTGQIEVPGVGSGGPVDVGAIARESNVVGEMLGYPTGPERAGAAGAGGQSRPAPPGTAPASSPGSGGQQRVGGAYSAPGGDPSDTELREGIRVLDQLIERMQSEDPHGALGGFFDPLPGSGAPRRAAGPRRPREPRTPRAKRDRVAEMMGPQAGQEDLGTIGEGGTFTQVTEIPIPEGSRPAVPPPAKKKAPAKPAPKSIDEQIDELVPPQSEQPDTEEFVGPRIEDAGPSGVNDQPRQEDAGPAEKLADAFGKDTKLERAAPKKPLRYSEGLFFNSRPGEPRPTGPLDEGVTLTGAVKGATGFDVDSMIGPKPKPEPTPPPSGPRSAGREIPPPAARTPGPAGPRPPTPTPTPEVKADPFLMPPRPAEVDQATGRAPLREVPVPTLIEALKNAGVDPAAIERVSEEIRRRVTGK